MGIDERVALLGFVGRFFDRGMDLVVQNDIVVDEGTWTWSDEDEFWVNYEMFFWPSRFPF